MHVLEQEAVQKREGKMTREIVTVEKEPQSLKANFKNQVCLTLQNEKKYDLINTFGGLSLSSPFLLSETKWGNSKWSCTHSK